MKYSAVWTALGLFLISVATTIGFQDNPHGWKYRNSMIASILFGVLFLAGLIYMIRNMRKR